MEIISLVSLVIILVILFFIFSTTPKKVEQFDATADLIFNQDEFVDFEKFNKEPKYAKYGSEGKNNVVTDIIKKNFEIWKSNRFRVTNDNMGGNPNAGEEKKLRIWF